MSPSFDEDGYTFIRSVVNADACRRMGAEVDRVIREDSDNAIRDRGSRVVGGRNLLSRWHGWPVIFQCPALRQFVAQTLGTRCGVVRILYFDKPPGRGWSLALHRDRTIAVQRHCTPLSPFSKPTRKAGVPHVEANNAVLTNMLTVRLHLDAMHDRNGPLIVVPGSHRSDQAGEAATAPAPGATQTIKCDQGDVFAMRPLLSHGSLAAEAGCAEHRRVVHIELAADATLPAEFQWHAFASLGQWLDSPSGDSPSGDSPSGDSPSGDSPSGDSPSGDSLSGEAQ